DRNVTGVQTCALPISNDPGVTRWDALKTALLDPAGAIGALQDQVRFGVVFYAGGSRNSTCPVLDEGGDPATLMPPRTGLLADFTDRKSTRLNSSHVSI